MSHQYSKDQILYLQRMWQSEGLYIGELDGYWGPASNEAEHVFESEFNRLKNQFGTYDQRTESNVFTLTLSAQVYARLCMRMWWANDVPARIISGARTYREQADLYAQGRTKPGKRVTNAKPGQSKHNFSTAWDIGLFPPGGGYSLIDQDYIDAASTVRQMHEKDGPVFWGGNFESIDDNPHYELSMGMGIAEIRAGFEAGDMFGIHQMKAVA